MLAALVSDGLAMTERWLMRAGRRPITVTWLMITDAGRRAFNGRSTSETGPDPGW
jgi:hypothetical protein